MKFLSKISDRAAGLFLKTAKKIPAVRKKMESEYAEIMSHLEESLKPYRDKWEVHTKIPSSGLKSKDVLSQIDSMRKTEEKNWNKGFASGAVYHGDQSHINFLNKVYAAQSQSNPLHTDLWPSAVKYEAEIVAMTGDMLHSEEAQKMGDEVCGTVTSGGTESILLAMKTYRDYARVEKGIKKPEMLVPETVHAAFDKASSYFGIKMVKAKIGPDFRVDINDVKKKITSRTIVIVGSAPSFPHGIIDNIEELSNLALQKKIPFHTDACLGGFLLPWIEKLDYHVPTFDFRLPGVTSISVDTHKYGYAAKGTSVILYRNKELRHFQFYKITDWPGGLYFSPTMAGSRPGALSATAWAAMIKMGQNGYLNAAQKIMKAAEVIKKGIQNIPELYILGDPLWNIAFGSDSLNIYRIMEYMNEKNWSLNGLHRPSAVHICVTLTHTRENTTDRFIKDLTSAVKKAKKFPEDKGEMAPVYGMAATIPDREMVSDLLDLYMDTIYKP